VGPGGLKEESVATDYTKRRLGEVVRSWTFPEEGKQYRGQTVIARRPKCGRKGERSFVTYGAREGDNAGRGALTFLHAERDAFEEGPGNDACEIPGAEADDVCSSMGGKAPEMPPRSRAVWFRCLARKGLTAEEIAARTGGALAEVEFVLWGEVVPVGLTVEVLRRPGEPVLLTAKLGGQVLGRAEVPGQHGAPDAKSAAEWCVKKLTERSK
jgi:hypothetical protein